MVVFIVDETCRKLANVFLAPFIMFFPLTYYSVLYTGRLGLRSSEMKKVIATLKALVEVMEALSGNADPNGVGKLINEEVLISFVILCDL